MKLNKKILLNLLSLSTTFGLFEPKRLYKAVLNVNYAMDENKSMALANCQKALDSFGECQITSLNISRDNLCASFSTERCQNFFKFGISGIEQCNGIPDIVEQSANLSIEELSLFDIELCSKNELEQYCPLSEYSLSDEEYDFLASAKLFDEAINKTCFSKKCLDRTIEYYEKYIEFQEKVNKIKENFNSNSINEKRNFDSSRINETNEDSFVLEYLKSNECSSQIKIETENQSENLNKASSDATTIKYSNMIFVSLGLLLSYLL